VQSRLLNGTRPCEKPPGISHCTSAWSDRSVGFSGIYRSLWRFSFPDRTPSLNWRSANILLCIGRACPHVLRRRRQCPAMGLREADRRLCDTFLSGRPDTRQAEVRSEPYAADLCRRLLDCRGRHHHRILAGIAVRSSDYSTYPLGTGRVNCRSLRAISAVVREPYSAPQSSDIIPMTCFRLQEEWRFYGNPSG
jgi:hypothetical protein